jgi:Pyruvate/2-oxoacid:ferredoxin oxidoreductase delta subunit
MDAILAMEGNGPRTGNPRQLGVLLLSSDPIALDATASRIVNLPPEFMPTSAPGEKSGLGTYHAENIDVLGESIESFTCEEFEVIRTAPVLCSAGRLQTFAKNRICERPKIDKSKCTNCGTCVEMCPVEPKAVNWHGGDEAKLPWHKYGRCIRCYCCQETCPEGAISVENPLLGRIFTRI